MDKKYFGKFTYMAPCNKGAILSSLVMLTDDDVCELVALGKMEHDASASDLEKLAATIYESGTVWGYFDGRRSAVVPLIFGGISNNGEVWMLTTNMIKLVTEKDKPAIWAAMQHSLDMALEQFDEVHNIVWAENKRHIAIIKHFGAEFGEPFHVNDWDVFIPFKFRKHRNRGGD